MNFFEELQNSIISSVKRFGSIEEILIRLISFTRSNSFIKSKKDSLFLFPKSPMFTPVRTISLLPDFTISFAAFIVADIDPLLLLPLANGIVQNEHV